MMSMSLISPGTLISHVEPFQTHGIRSETTIAHIENKTINGVINVSIYLSTFIYSFILLFHVYMHKSAYSMLWKLAETGMCLYKKYSTFVLRRHMLHTELLFS